MNSDLNNFKRGDQVLIAVSDTPVPATFRRYDADGLCVVKVAPWDDWCLSSHEIVIDPNLVTPAANTITTSTNQEQS